MQKITFIGLGNMGAPMALNLLRAGYDLTVFDLMQPAVDKLVAEGAKSRPSIAEAVEVAEVIITMLPGDAQMKPVYLDPAGILAHVPPSALLIDCSTISARLAQEVATAAKNSMLDAPVSGGTAGAAAGTLTFMVGGDTATLEAVRPILQKMGKNIFHAGGHGAGQVVKMCNNMLLAIQMIGTSEALNLGAAYGLDPKTLSAIMAQSSGRNWTLEVYNPYPGVMENVPASREYSGGFGTDLMVKDLGLAMDGAQAKNTATPLGKLAQSLYQQHSGAGSGKLDFSSIIKLLAAG